MPTTRLDTWLRRLRVTATLVHTAALCLAVALLVIAFIGQRRHLDLPVR